MFVNKHFMYLGCIYLKKQTVLQCEAFGILFFCEDKDIDICIHIFTCWYLHIHIRISAPLTVFHTFFFSISIVDFEQVNAGWVRQISFFFYVFI